MTARNCLTGCLVVASLLLPACSSLYFHSLDASVITRGRPLSQLEWNEYWTGIVFNGEKIGFSHQRIEPVDDRFRLQSEAALRLHFLTLDKQLSFVSEDIIDQDLQLQRLAYTYVMDNSRRKLTGYRQNNRLYLQLSNAEQTEDIILDIEHTLYPLNAIYLYPVLHGLETGKTYHFKVFDGETLAIYPVQQHITAYQSSALFSVNAYKIESDIAGITTTTWIDASGLPQLELSLHGVMISALENESNAKAYLTRATLSKQDILLSLILIKTEHKFSDPRTIRFMQTRLRGTPRDFTLPLSANQDCYRQDQAWLCQQHRFATHLKLNSADYLLPSFTIPSQAYSIDKLATAITQDMITTEDQVNAILNWMHTHIARADVDSFSALDVLNQRKAECQGHSFLYAALARNRGIPTRLINGLVYSAEYQGFLYHTWAESFIDGNWQALDPTFGQRHADATHIALVEGESLADLTPLLRLIGKLQVDVLDYQPQ